MVATLTLLADLELEHRWHSAIHLRWRQSALTEKLTIDHFDFDYYKSRKEQKTRILALCNLVNAMRFQIKYQKNIDNVRKEVYAGNPDVTILFMPGYVPMNGRKLSTKGAVGPYLCQRGWDCAFFVASFERSRRDLVRC